ncbi:MAG TPA: PQQ-dependent dehydrogenase, methanol/ethanol family, partial [Methylophaga sp.]|nr:PQQ-dependent dehydrogenase, methanol/ethanol family [Methylophaga sp.]
MKLKTLSIAMMGLAAPGLVAADELIEMQKNANNWVMPAGNYANTRYSELTQITKDNVKDLKMAWSFSTGVLRGHEGNALVM